MHMIAPIDISDSIISTNITEDEYPDWDSTTNFVIGDRVIVPAEHSVYEAAADNIDSNPTTAGTTDWFRVGATNKYKPFDGKISDATTNATEVTYEFTPNKLITSVALFNLGGAEACVTVTDPTDGVVYDETKELVDNAGIIDWFQYYFAEPSPTLPEVLFTGIPPYIGATTKVTIKSTGTAQVGQIVVGNDVVLGHTKTGSSISIEDFSTKSRDTFGNPIIVERDFAELVDFDVAVETQNARRVRNLIAERRAKPTVFYAAPDTEYLGMLIYGIPGNFNLNMQYYSTSHFTLEVEGLV